MQAQGALRGQVLDVQLRGARLMLQHAGGLELVLALADAYSRYAFAPYVSPNPLVRRCAPRACGRGQHASHRDCRALPWVPGQGGSTAMRCNSSLARLCIPA